ncbi:serine acetyltransferase 1, chloroplastic-like [Tasmannia lanceolata]|uniref:serine acetyltransferase 1, chloroplastic-like n=1 Tax=Tasmannia lanceolata TaxID=3420 RepID=UPI004064AB01
MSVSLLQSQPSILIKTLQAKSHLPTPRTMVACVDNSSAARSKNHLNPNSDRLQIENSLFNYVKFARSNFCDIVTCAPISQDRPNPIDPPPMFPTESLEDVWPRLLEEARSDVQQEPILGNYYFSVILSHNSLESALANHLAAKLSNQTLPSNILFEVFSGVFKDDREIRRAMREDLKAAKDRDPACLSLVHCLLNYKGFLAIQAHRVAHKFWRGGRKVLAFVIQNRVSEVFAVDIHPGAKIGHGILLDHATGVVIGETAVIGNYVSILHNVTLGGTGKVSGDRHPKIGDGVLIGAGTQVLGNVRVGEGAKIGAGSVVVKEVPARTTVVGNPARLVGGKENPIKLDRHPSFTMDHTSWSDYVI